MASEWEGLSPSERLSPFPSHDYPEYETSSKQYENGPITILRSLPSFQGCTITITFQKGSGLELVAFAEADYASKATGRTSVSGGVVMCAGACVRWFSRIHKCVALSTTEAKYIAPGSTVEEKTVFIRYVWSLVFPGFGATCITASEDNEGARHLAQNPECTSNSKHIDVRHHFLRELIFRGEFTTTHVETEEQHADFLTKPLSNAVFCYQRDFLMNI